MDFKRVSEISAVAIPFLMLGSCIRLITYYSHWNIPIVDYLAATELIMLFIWPILTIIGLGIVYLVFNLVFVGAIWLFVRRTGKTREQKPVQEEVEPAAEKKKTRWELVTGYLVFAVGLVGIGFTFFQGIWYDYELMPVVIFHVLVWFAVAVLLQKTIGTTDRLSVELFIIATVFTILCASFFYGRYQAHYATAYPVAQTIVLADGNTISTDANVVYLGKTSGFYFYYKIAEKEALVLPAAQIKSVSIKQAE